MKIGFVCCEYPPGPHGGIGSLTQMLARALSRVGHEVQVAGVYLPSYPAPDFEEDHGVLVWRLRESLAPLGWLAARWRLYNQIADWARRGQVDIVEFPDYQGWAAGWPVLPVPAVVRLHGSETYFAAELQRRVHTSSFWLERAALNRSDFSCSVCKYTARKTQEVFNLKSSCDAVLYNPIELAAAPSCWNGSARVVFTGTLTSKKGVVSLIRAWPAVIAKCPDAELHVYGKDGRAKGGWSMRAFLHSQLPDEVRPTVRFYGHVPRVALLNALSKAGAAVFPSYAETFAMAPLEAMSCGCPTIYSRRGSGPELIEDGRHGLLVEPDRPQEIADAIVRILKDRVFARSLGEAGRERASNVFSMERLLPENVAFYERCIEAFQARNGISRERQLRTTSGASQSTLGRAPI